MTAVEIVSRHSTRDRQPCLFESSPALSSDVSGSLSSSKKRAGGGVCSMKFWTAFILLLVSKTCKTSTTNEQNKALLKITDPVVVHTEVSCDDLVDFIDRICKVNRRMVRMSLLLRMARMLAGMPSMSSMRMRSLLSIISVVSPMNIAMSDMVFRRIDLMSGISNMVIRRTVSTPSVVARGVMMRIWLRPMSRLHMTSTAKIKPPAKIFMEGCTEVGNELHFRVLDIPCRSVRNVRLARVD